MFSIMQLKLNPRKLTNPCPRGNTDIGTYVCYLITCSLKTNVSRKEWTKLESTPGIKTEGKPESRSQRGQSIRLNSVVSHKVGVEEMNRVVTNLMTSPCGWFDLIQHQQSVFTVRMVATTQKLKQADLCCAVALTFSPSAGITRCRI